MTSFDSVLFPGIDPPAADPRAPDCFGDLNLDQIMAEITAGREEYNLAPFLHAPLEAEETIAFRQEVMRDLEVPEIMAAVRAFAAAMRAMRDGFARSEALPYLAECERWHLDAANSYCGAVANLLADLTRRPALSRGLAGFRDHLARLAGSERFVALRDDAGRVRDALKSIRYALAILGLKVEVTDPGDAPDYGAEIGALFDRFRQSEVERYRFRFAKSDALTQVDSMILDRVSGRHPDCFADLDSFCRRHADFVDPTVARFDREIQFYVACQGFVSSLREAGLAFCYPDFSSGGRDIFCRDGFDLALAHARAGEDRKVVANGFSLEGEERVLVVTGPNQGGKTTFARAFGQIHYLARLGWPVPGREARLFLCDAIHTHFERQEDIADLSGKLKDDLVRIHAILGRAGPRSIVIINEIFSSTTFRDARELSRKIADRLAASGPVCVWVTFIDELAALDARMVSMVSEVEPDEPSVRTHRIVRRPADGLAFARTLAEKHRLTREMIEERLRG